MKILLQISITRALILCVALLFAGNGLSAQEATTSKPPVIQQNNDDKTADQEQKTVQQSQKKSGELQQDQKQIKNVKKVKDSSPDLTKKRGARPPSISRPSGNAMPKGAGKPAGVIRPGRR